jgi:5'-phosphate synthase pdxT subunit
VRVGVLAVQGAVSEHLDALRRAAEEKGLDVEAIAVRTAKDLEGTSGIILPGGESTTISRLLRSGGLQQPILDRAGKDLAVFGTCAGLILISKSAVSQVEDKDIQLLGLLDAEVDRNAFGRQRDSFESSLDVKGIGEMPAVFIRAPVVTKAGKATEVLARNERGIVAVRKGLVLGTAFHPELTDDTRLHELFLDLCGQAESGSSRQGAGPGPRQGAEPGPRKGTGSRRRKGQA